MKLLVLDISSVTMYFLRQWLFIVIFLMSKYVANDGHL